jgi:capsular exopolysaccharide synthesis family protein
MGYKTLLIDSDLRKPVLHELFKINSDVGLIDLIQNPYFNAYHPGIRGEGVLVENAVPLTTSFAAREDREEQDVESKLAAIHNVIRETDIANLNLITCGQRTSNASGLLNSYAIQTILNTTRLEYDVIFLDTPPINVVVDASIVSRHVNSAILVIRVGKSNERDIIRAKSILEQSKVASILLVLNEVLGQNGYSKYYYSA